MRKLNCLVTGASSGIGMNIAIELSKIAKHIYILARDVNRLEKVHDIIIDNNSNCTIVPLDLCEENGIENLSQQILKKDSYLDIIVLSAGQISHLSPVSSIDLKESKYILKLNYLSNLKFIRSFHSLLMNSKEARLAVISSIKNDDKSQYWGIYQPLMTALNELILMYANENKNTQIKANIFCPDSVNTKFRDKIMPGENKESLKSPEYVAKKVIDILINKNDTGSIYHI